MTLLPQKQIQESLNKIKQDFSQAIASIRGSRPTPALVENIKVSCYGGKSLLKNIASISIQLPKTIVIEPWDQSLREAISKAILSSSLSLTPNTNGNQILLFLPALSQERRKELIKLIGQEKEEARIKLKQMREEFLSQIKKSFQDKEITEDEKYRRLDEIQELIKKINSELDTIEERKVKELEEG